MKTKIYSLLTLFLCLQVSISQAQTSLSAGDIAFVGWNSYDASNGTTYDDQIAFVLLKDVSAGTVIYFTDLGWCSNPQKFQTANPAFAYANQSDGIIKWTAPSGTTVCGTLVWLKTKYLTTAPLTNVGTVTGVRASIASTTTPPLTYVSIPSGADQVFAFQVAAGNVAALSSGDITNPTLLAGFDTRVAWDVTLDETTTFSPGSSILPAALGSSATLIIPSANANDLSTRRNARFNCSGNTTASAGVLRANMTNSANWIFNQLSDITGVYNFASFGCTFTCSAATPDITVQPSAQTTCDGRTASFSITALNTTGYQWQISTNGGANYSNLANGGVYSNVTTATLNISNATGLDGNFYRCVASNAIPASVNSNGVKLNVNRFVLQPANMTSCNTCAAGFTVSARGLGLTYQWQISNDNGATFANITNGGVYGGATTRALSISSASGLTGKQYRCVLGGCASPINSNAAILTVTGTAQTTLTQGDVAIVAYNSLDDAAGGATQDDEIVFVLLKDIVAGTEVSLTDFGWRSDTQAFLSGVTTSCAGGIIKWIAGSNLTCGTQVKVKSKYLLEASTGVVLPIATNSNDATVYISLSASDVIFAFQGLITSPTLLYGLHMNAWTATVTSCTGAGTSALPTVLNAAGFNLALGRDGTAGKDWNNANYNCTNVSATPSTLRTSISSAATWTKNINPVSLPICTFTCTNGAPQIDTQPSNTITCDGRAASFSVVSPGSNTYKWQIFNGVSWDYLVNNAIYTNVTTATLNISNATGLDGKQYRCEVTNAVTFINSNSAGLTVNRFRNQSVNMTTCTNCQAAFAVVGLGSGLTFQWQESSNSGTTFTNITNGGVYSGATSTILRLSNVSTPTNLNNRQYRVILGGCPVPINSENKILSISANAATAIVAGDVSFIGYNTVDDGVNGQTQDDEFAFILLKDINAGTEINFTDFGWRSDANAFHESSTNCGANLGATGDGILKWIAGSNLTCGTQISIKSKYTLQATLGVAYGVQSIAVDPTAFLSFPTTGDQIFAFTGTYASPTLIAGLSMKSWDATLTTCEQTGTKSVKPAALNGFVVEFVGASGNSFASYKCSATLRDIPSVLRAATQNTANWDVNNVTPYTFPLACSFCCSPPFSITHPSNQSVCVGSAAAFSVATSPSGQTFQWQLDSGAGFANISNVAPYGGTGTNALSISATTSAMNNYLYRCVITDACGNTNSNSATLTIPTIANPTSVTPAINTTVNHPNAISLSATCLSGSQVVWYGSLTGTASIGTGTPFGVTPNPSVSGNYTYYALCRQTAAPTCISPNRIATSSIYYCGLIANNLPNFNAITQSVKAATSIDAINQITGASNILYQGGSFIQLSPGFSVAQGSVFKAQMGGCN